ncbi:MAG TPA: type II toxin-antitoxin system RelE/ParE family toxin [Cellulomonas sp.]
MQEREVRTVDHGSQALIVDAIDRLAAAGPSLGRPLVDRVKGASVHSMKVLRPGSNGRTEIRILLVIDPDEPAVGRRRSGSCSGPRR